MGKVLLRFSGKRSRGTCGVCDQETIAAPGCQLCLADTGDLVCNPCGRRHAPELFALVDLSDTAERVGRIACFGISPPMVALLQLARAAEEFTRTTTPTIRQAG